MGKPVVQGAAVVSQVMLVGQAPGDKEPVLGRPFTERVSLSSLATISVARCNRQSARACVS